MALPTTRDETITAASQIKAALLNKLQDMIVGHKKPSLMRTTPSLHAALSPTWVYDFGTGYIQSSSSTSACIGLLVEAGDRITGVSIMAQGDGVVDATYTLRAVTAAGVVTTLCNAQADNNRSVAWGTVSLVLSPATYVMSANEMLHLLVSPNAGNYRVGSVSYTYDRL